MERPLLEMKGISRSFPGVKALENVDLSIAAGEVHALLGENGAGKSTLMKILAGVLSKDSGQILLKGKRILERAKPKEAAHEGISMIFQEFSLFPQLTVAENIFLPSARLRPINRKKMNAEASRILGILEADISPTALVEDLSVSEQQLVEIAKALSRRANLLIMDEPTSALSNREAKALCRLMRSLAAQGMGIILITHRIQEIFEAADRVTVLRDGRLIGTVSVSETSVEELVQMMVGRKIDDSIESKMSPGEPLLEVKGLSKKNMFHDISFSLRRGEIVGMAGLMGSGRTEVAKAIFGAIPRDAGEILIKGRPAAIFSPIDAIRSGIALLTEDRKREGLVLSMSVFENITLPVLKSISRLGLIRGKRAKELAEGFRKELNIRTPSLLTAARQLSGGNQQKVVLAKWLASRSEILIVDEPTRGIDIGAKMEIYMLLRELADNGKAILMISSELPEILKMSDRVLVMHEGRIAGEFSRREATEEKIMMCATGGYKLAAKNGGASLSG